MICNFKAFSNRTHWGLSKQASQFQVDSPNSREMSSTALLMESHRAALLTELCVNILLLYAAGKLEPTPNYFHFQDALNETSTWKCLTKLWWRRVAERCMQHAIIKHYALYYCGHILANTIIWHLVTGQQCATRPLSFCQPPTQQPQSPYLSLLKLRFSVKLYMLIN